MKKIFLFLLIISMNQFVFANAITEKKMMQAAELLTSVLQAKESEVINTAQNQPELFFIKATANDFAKDLENNPRIIKNWSAYQAMFGTGDVDILVKVKPFLDAYLTTLPNGQQLAYDQEQEKFPFGIEFPKSSYDFSPLEQVINNDQQLIKTGKPSEATLLALTKFKAHFKPGIVEMGPHFNMNDLINARILYDQKWKEWNIEQLSFFNEYVMGFLQRLLTVPYAQRYFQGLFRLDHPLQRSYEVTLITGRKIVMLPLDLYSRYHLGSGFFIDDYGIGGKRVGWHDVDATFSLEQYIQKITDRLAKLMVTNQKHLKKSDLMSS